MWDFWACTGDTGQRQTDSPNPPRWETVFPPLAETYRLPRLPELVKEAIKTIFIPRWGRGRWRSTT